jgi:hypothetical protein
MLARAIGRVEPNGDNLGQLPEYLQLRNGGNKGEFYCMDTVGATGRDTLGKAWPLLLSGSCSQQRAYAKKKGALRSRAEFDAACAADPLSVLSWVMLVVDPAKESAPEEKAAGLPGHAHHTGVVGELDEATGTLIVNGPRGGFFTIEGNASDPTKGASRNGDGIYHGRERGHPGDKGLYEFIDTGAFP